MAVYSQCRNIEIDPRPEKRQVAPLERALLPHGVEIFETGDIVFDCVFPGRSGFPVANLRQRGG